MIRGQSSAASSSLATRARGHAAPSNFQHHLRLHEKILEPVRVAGVTTLGSNENIAIPLDNGRGEDDGPLAPGPAPHRVQFNEP
jgi:hypothetical protein